jgi:hypothetical protein
VPTAGPQPAAPVADFAFLPVEGVAPLEVQFVDRSDGAITSWLWMFGDGDSSTDRDPAHVYAAPGDYEVELSLVGPDGSDRVTLTGPRVAPPPPERPGPPVLAGFEPGDGFVIVSWNAPDNDGRSTITGYRIAAQPGDVTVSVGASSLSAVISPLDNGREYRFSIAAINDVGEGLPSVESGAVIPFADVAFDEAASLRTARSGNTATVLPDGRVLIVGGVADEQTLSSVEIYDPGSDRFTPGPPMGTARTNHTATLVHDGRVLITGGENSAGVIRSSEVFDPSRSIWESEHDLRIARANHIATVLADGRVIVAGGHGVGGAVLRSVEIWDLETEIWSTANEMPQARSGHTATLLDTGNLLVAGGVTADGDVASSAVLFRADTDGWTPTGGMTSARHMATAELLLDGRVLMAGGKEPTARRLRHQKYTTRSAANSRSAAI